jgi:hypothetical protein
MTENLDQSKSFEGKGSLIREDSRNDTQVLPTMTKLPSQISGDSTKLLPQLI